MVVRSSGHSVRSSISVFVPQHPAAVGRWLGAGEANDLALGREPLVRDVNDTDSWLAGYANLSYTIVRAVNPLAALGSLTRRSSVAAATDRMAIECRTR